MRSRMDKVAESTGGWIRAHASHSASNNGPAKELSGRRGRQPTRLQRSPCLANAEVIAWTLMRQTSGRLRSACGGLVDVSNRAGLVCPSVLFTVARELICWRASLRWRWGWRWRWRRVGGGKGVEPARVGTGQAASGQLALNDCAVEVSSFSPTLSNAASTGRGSLTRKLQSATRASAWTKPTLRRSGAI